MNQSLDTSVISNTQLNNSSSKMKYSFPRSSRFANNRYSSPSPNKFYDLPPLTSKRSAFMGLGNKVDFGKVNSPSPPPDSYKLKSEFEKKDKEGITIAPGREDVIAGNFFGRDQKNPPPNAYNPNIIKKAVSFSLYSRKPDLSENWKKKVPGPGTYSFIDVTTKKSPLSKYQTPPATMIGEMKRLSEAELKNKKTPGPGTYDNNIMISKKFISKSGNKFSHGQRKGLANLNKVPGPGQYQRASDFS